MMEHCKGEFCEHSHPETILARPCHSPATAIWPKLIPDGRDTYVDVSHIIPGETMADREAKLHCRAVSSVFMELCDEEIQHIAGKLRESLFQ